jgi:hypothetical protein
MRRLLLLPLAALSGCALYSDVAVGPLMLTPANIERGSTLDSMVQKADYLRAIGMASAVDAKPKKSASELKALGEAELASGRWDDARRHLRAAVDLEPFRVTYGQIAWDLSQLELMANNFDTAADWADIAVDHGVRIKEWHIAYLRALGNLAVYRFPEKTSDTVPMRFGNPDVPRVDVRINGTKRAEGIIDSGAVLSIISRKMAQALPVRSLGDFRGTFFGLLGEPIEVEFGLLDRIQIGGIVVENVPVAIMPDAMMHFLVSNKSSFNIDFLLGASLLKEFRLDLDFHGQTIALSHVATLDRHPVEEQNLFWEDFRPMVRSAVNRHAWFLFVLDTGSEVTFLNETRLASLPIQIFAPRVHTARLQGLGGSMKHGEKIEDVEIGVDRWAGTFRTLPVYEEDAREQAVGIVGENFLKNFHVVIDFSRMRVDLVPGRV